mmetsp:Transcript_18280/g.45477  ORF Transcript_18280/g.45477 Transcript_18280/m.45477 type:complete len:336 (-) Transcript_18280:872-1879(-)
MRIENFSTSCLNSAQRLDCAYASMSSGVSTSVTPPQAWMAASIFASPCPKADLASRPASSRLPQYSFMCRVYAAHVSQNPITATMRRPSISGSVWPGLSAWCCPANGWNSNTSGSDTSLFFLYLFCVSPSTSSSSASSPTCINCRLALAALSASAASATSPPALTLASLRYSKMCADNSAEVQGLSPGIFSSGGLPSTVASFRLPLAPPPSTYPSSFNIFGYAPPSDLSFTLVSLKTTMKSGQPVCSRQASWKNLRYVSVAAYIHVTRRRSEGGRDRTASRIAAALAAIVSAPASVPVTGSGNSIATSGLKLAGALSARNMWYSFSQDNVESSSE